MARVLRIAGSFAIVSMAYWIYARVAVPWIEPPADLRRVEAITKGNRAGRRLVESRLRQWKDRFAPDAWELRAPKILESDRIKLLMEDYRNLGGGRVRITPCTIIFMPEDHGQNETQRTRQAVVVQAPEGALLDFDRPIDLRRAKIGRLKSGRLIGPITIRSQGKNPGREDDLRIVTRDVQVTQRRVSTPHSVDFRLGPNYGRGQQMQIELIGAEHLKSSDRRGPNIAGIKSFRLERVDRLHLELGALKLAPDNRPGAAEKSAGSAPASDASSDLPVEITCHGPFYFDNLKKVATFREQVDVMRINPTGPSDQLHCELLSVKFVERAAAPGGTPAQNASNKPGPGSLDLQPRQIEARGNPVVVSAPSEGAYARGERLVYDLSTNWIWLGGSDQVFLRQGPNEIHARNVQYWSAGPGRVGRLVAQGPGWLRGELADRPGEQLIARWSKYLNVRPREQNQVISLSGEAGMQFHGIGQLEAEEIHFWLTELPGNGRSGRSELRPNRMLARKNVRINSPQLSGAVDQMQVWFEYAPTAPGGKPKAREEKRQAAMPPGGRRRAGLVLTAYRPPPLAGRGPVSMVPYVPAAVAAVSGVYPIAAPGQPATPRPARAQHFRIAGRLLQARMMIKGNQQTEISELIVEDGVDFMETQSADPHERPLLVTGDRLHVVHAGKPHAAVTVLGRPAHFEGRGLGLFGSNINLNRGTNRLWINGPGRMDVPMDRDLEGRPLPNASVLRIYWQKEMNFDGRTARFEKSVTAIAPNRHLQTDTLEAQFKRPIRFSDTHLEQQNPEVEQLLCRGSVYMENAGFHRQEQTSYDRMQVFDLVLNRTSGALTAGGPGWISSVRRGADDPLAGQIGNNFSRTPTAPADDGQLRGLHVRFQGSLTGNLHDREMTFHDRVRATYAPVDSWHATLDTSDPETLGPGGVVMHCNRLTVNEMKSPTGTHRELEATRNIIMEGNRQDGTFTARALRMTYTEAKGMLVLEGDGRTDAELFRQQHIGGPTSRAAAGKIFFWPKTNRLKVDRVRSLELSRFAPTRPDGS